MLKQQLDGDTLLGQQFLFAQGMGGIKIKIQFPFLKNWFETGKVVINDAQLFLGNASVSETFYNPSTITLNSIGESGTTNPEKMATGSYNLSSNSYRFQITRYIQQVLTGKIKDKGLHLVIPNAEYLGTRLVLNGTSSPQSDLKLYLRYTKIE